MKTRYFWVLLFSISWLVSCENSKEKQQESKSIMSTEFIIVPEHDTYQVKMVGYDSAVFSQHYENRIAPPPLNLNQDLTTKSISELILLKNTLLAMKGKVLTDAMYHAYFDSLQWYQPPYWDSDFQIELNDAEQQFVDRIKLQTDLLLSENYSQEGMPKVDHILNSFQFSHLEKIPQLENNGFTLIKSSLNQPHEIYEQNKLENYPSFITTDLIMHQMHLFYGVLENEIEEVYLTQKLKSMLEIINLELYSTYEKTLDPHIEKAIEENLLYYSIPYGVITGKKTNLIGSYSEQYVDELGKVLKGEGNGSKILDDPGFNYEIFKPHDQYTKNDLIEKYYKAITWLQKIDLCLNDENNFKKALIIAYIINKSDELKHEYHEYIELKTYFSSQKDQLTLWNLADEIARIGNIRRFEDLFKQEIISKIRDNLSLKSLDNCQLSVSLMPIEFQNRFTDLREISKKNTASSFDLFAALSNPAALEIYNSENTAGTDQNYMTEITDNLVIISSQEDARSMDWISTLLTSFTQSLGGQQYMSHSPWQRKELVSAMGSWVQLNQRVNLNAIGKKQEQKNGKNKILKGYVEPNINFWRSAQTLLENTHSFLSDRGMLSKKSKTNLTTLMDIVMFLNNISKKELSGTMITDEEFSKINSIGNECHNLSLKMINPNFNTTNQKISSKMAYATNVFNAGVGKNLIAGVGHPNYLLAIVEIDGYLYLTRGATYSYYEIPNFTQNNIANSQWKKILDELNPVEWSQPLYHQGDSEREDMLAVNRVR